ncbi:MAG: type III toxin-antitoxin system ToxN/AbiQ family toxin [Ruminococcaceae bacterium]|nr:type III toxin-antitoxin system ToxN/AbiQ family toxin [Oscillospiraceae bacterium]
MRNLISELLLVRSRKLKVSVSLLEKRKLYDEGKAYLPSFAFSEDTMDNIKFYEINKKYITYLSAYAPHMFQNKKDSQKNERKYIGIVFRINDFDYFAPLSSFKDKHRMMKEGIDFIKVKDYAVINLNNMFPVPLGESKYVDIRNERDPHYRALLLSEYRYIKSIQEKIWKNAQNLYKIKTKDGENSPLTKRCNDFILLEKACADYIK